MIDIISVLRSLSRKNVHGMGKGVQAGIGPRSLYIELSGQFSARQLTGALEEEIRKGSVLLVGRKGRYGCSGAPTVIGNGLDVFMFHGSVWKRVIDDEEEYFNNLRIYVVADGIPVSVAKQGVIKRALERLKKQN